MPLPADYVERVYAGVLGKLIGVYLGRPIEHMTYDQIMAELGEIWGYVHQQRGIENLIITDDDISGTFTFLRALEDHGYDLNLTAAQIGQTWLNYIVENRTILWWGGLGNSTEHTAYLRLKEGIPAPRSGSAALNGAVTANQIGAQIFIDGWAMISPGDPAQAASLAQRAASVSHDQEAVYAAQVVAAMEALAFVEPNIDRLLDTGVSFIPNSSIIYRLIHDLREWHAAEDDWRVAHRLLVDRYGYQRFNGIVHVVPNHALIILGLLYGQGDFRRSLMITNTCGWDTDCNSGNLGCLLGIRNGLAGIEAHAPDQPPADLRGPVADRIFLPTADGGRFVTDAVTESFHIVNVARRLQGEAPLQPKAGVRFHFELPGSVQGFLETPEISLQNVAGHSRRGQRCLQIRAVADQPWQAVTGTFVQPHELTMKNYEIMASPTLYPGQTIQCGVWADEENTQPISIALVIRYYDGADQAQTMYGPSTVLGPGESTEIQWRVPKLDGMPIFGVGIAGSAAGTLYLDYLTWSGAAETLFCRPAPPSQDTTVRPHNYRLSWVNAVDQWDSWYADAFRISQNRGRGLLLTGTQAWRDYTVSAQIRIAVAKSAGLVVRAQGLRRYMAWRFVSDGRLQLCKVFDDTEVVLAEAPFDWTQWQPYDVTFQAKDNQFTCWVDGQCFARATDSAGPLLYGSVGLLIEEGHMMTDAVRTL